MEATSVCIGIQVYAEPDCLRDTLASLRANTHAPFDLMLLPDGPDGATNAALATMAELRRSATMEPRGAAACFNRLAAESDADIVILLESGAQVGPRWLEYLLAALDADPRNGLAGPTTNLAWNEQCVYPGSGGKLDEIARIARDAAARFGDEARSLEPLYSLADFCYAVRREVIDEIGAADETYATGPCWEMDYNIRAARAGFNGVWACAAYVHRAPFTMRRRFDEDRLFTTSKRRYQDKFCGARLRGEHGDYREHCRGDACPNFAPASLIEIKQPFVSAPQLLEARADATAEAMAEGMNVIPAIASTRNETSDRSLHVVGEPLVSCIMPTYNRRRFIPQSLRLFLRQDFPNLELIVVDDGADSIADCIPPDPRIRYFRLDQKLTIGAKRNFACRQSSGEFIVHWDDDDWYPASRVREQVIALRDAEVCGSSRIYYYDPVSDLSWEYRYPASTTVWVGGNTLAYRKLTWERSPFPDLQIGEDSHFVCNGGKAIRDLADPSLCVGMAHAGNTSRKETGGICWRAQPPDLIHQLLGDELDVYRAMINGCETAQWPLVSCIMPTRQRRPFIPLALRCFLDQDYPNREMIIVDDGEDAVGDLVENLPRSAGVRYFHLPSRASIGAKRNRACDEARGEIIAHWDDDDWYAPDRLRYQVTPILAGQAEITGLISEFVLELPSAQFWTARPELHRRMFLGDVHGGTLVYRKDLLGQGLRYPDVDLAEDAWLLHFAMGRGKRLRQLANPGVFVYVRHSRNAWREFLPGSFLNPAGWERIAAPVNFSEAILASYRSAAALVKADVQEVERINVA